MKKPTNLTLFAIISILFFGCFEATTNSSPKFKSDFGTVKNEIKTVSMSESVDFVDEISIKDNDTVKREIRIDLLKPKDFPNNDRARQIAKMVKANLLDKTRVDLFKINEVAPQSGNTITFPNPNILKSISVKGNDIN